MSRQREEFGEFVLVNVALTDDAIQKKSTSVSKSKDNCGANAPGGGGFQPGNDCAAGRNETPDTLSKKIEQSGGYTYRPADDSSPDSGFSVSIFPEREEIMELSEATPEAIADYIINNLDILQSDERVHIGAWYNKKTDENTDGDDKVYFDLAVVLDDQEEAVQLAKDNGQLKIFDLGSFEEIVTLTPEERKKWEDEQNNKSQPHFSKAKIMGRRRNRKDGDQLVQGYAGAKARPTRASRSKSKNSQANGVACLPPHETLWLSVFKSDDGPKSDCGANAPGGGGFQPGNDCASDKDGKNLKDSGRVKKPSRHRLMPRNKKEKSDVEKYFKSLSNQSEYTEAIRDLTYERAAFFDEEGKIVGEEKSTYEKDQVDFLKDGYDIPKGTVMVHNHPSEASLSPSDVVFGIARGQRKVIATTKSNNYEMTYPQGVSKKLIDGFKKSSPEIFNNFFVDVDGEKVSAEEAIKSGSVAEESIAQHIAFNQINRIDSFVYDRQKANITKYAQTSGVTKKDLKEYVKQANQLHYHSVNEVFTSWANSIGVDIEYKKTKLTRKSKANAK
tara:strand:+ start:1429 stop:3102 length:1674 start_codon:yes stop_codon:yes gene_type:complete